MTHNDSNASGWNYTLTYEKTSGQGDTVFFEYTPEGTISETGGDEAYIPPYITVYCWQRTA